jgi:hypothetical protein
VYASATGVFTTATPVDGKDTGVTQSTTSDTHSMMPVSAKDTDAFPTATPADAKDADVPQSIIDEFRQAMLADGNDEAASCRDTAAPPHLTFLGTPVTRRFVATFLKRQGASRRELEDLVQSTLTSACAAKNPPREWRSLPRWVLAIAYARLVDHWRYRETHPEHDPSLHE